MLAAFAALAGCGPISSGVQIIHADIALSAAKTAGAERHAVYEYTAATQYLAKAREENAYSDFWKSLSYAEKAMEYATKARKKAEVVSQAEQPTVLTEP